LQIVLIILAVLLVLLAVLLGVCIYFFNFAIVRPNPNKKKKKDAVAKKNDPGWDTLNKTIDEQRENFLALKPENIQITAHDGIPLYGYFLPYDKNDEKNARATMILFHGYKSHALMEMMTVYEFYREELHLNLLIVSQRAHSYHYENDTRFSCFGVKERYDCLSWINYINERIGVEVPVTLDGISMGAATVMMASGLDLPDNVKAIVADCGFTSPWEEFRHVLKTTYKLPPFPILHCTSLLSKCVAGFGFRDCSTVDAMKKNHIPVIFLHGIQDDFVPPHMSITNYEACAAPKEIFLVENAGHGMSYVTEQELCKQKLRDFLDKHAPDRVKSDEIITDNGD